LSFQLQWFYGTNPHIDTTALSECRLKRASTVALLLTGGAWAIREQIQALAVTFVKRDERTVALAAAAGAGHLTVTVERIACPLPTIALGAAIGEVACSAQAAARLVNQRSFAAG